MMAFLEQCPYPCPEQANDGFWPSFGRILQQLGRWIEGRAQLARQRQQLLDMDDHLLKDIGLSRADALHLAGNCRPRPKTDIPDELLVRYHCNDH